MIQKYVRHCVQGVSLKGLQSLRAKRRFLLCFTLFYFFVSGSVLALDFDPRGRKKKTEKKTPPSKSSQNEVKQDRPSDLSKKKDEEKGSSPSPDHDEVSKYMGLVLTQPHSFFHLSKLVDTVRRRDGKLDALYEEMKIRVQQAKGEEKYGPVVALANLYKMAGKKDEAQAYFELALELKPNDPNTILFLAKWYQENHQLNESRAQYIKIVNLPLGVVHEADRVHSLRALMSLSLDLKDFDSAQRYQAQLASGRNVSLFTKSELAQELLARGEFDRAIVEYQKWVNISQGDRRALVLVLKNLGLAQAKALRFEEARKTLKKTLVLAGQGTSFRAEIYDILTNTYRDEQKLNVWINELEVMTQGGSKTDLPVLSLLASLYEETGKNEEAVRTYKRVLSFSPRNSDLRIKLVRLLQAQGHLDEAISEYEKLIHQAPYRVDFVFDLCEALQAKGEKNKAKLKLFELETRLFRQASNHEDALLRLADVYSRMGENEASLRVSKYLADTLGQLDSTHLATLGSSYFDQGKKELALQTWSRILTAVKPKEKAYSLLGDIYLEHGMEAQALEAINLAITSAEGKNKELAIYKKQLATVYEKIKQFQKASEIWEWLYSEAQKRKASQKNSPVEETQIKEARAKLITLYFLQKKLESIVEFKTNIFQKSQNLALKKETDPVPHIEIGFFLVDAFFKLNRMAEAEQVCEKLVSLDPQNKETYLSYERATVSQKKYEKAIWALEKLRALDPSQSKTLLLRMSQYASAGYKDKEASEYAALAVEQNPEDAEAYKRLGDLYKSQKEDAKAIAAYRMAIKKNSRMIVAYFLLAELLKKTGGASDKEEAYRLYVHVVRSSSDEDLIYQAGEFLIELKLADFMGLGSSSLSSFSEKKDGGFLSPLENELLPLAIQYPSRRVYRKLLMHYYASVVPRWQNQARVTDAGDSNETAQNLAAKSKLEATSKHAFKLLLDVLLDGDLNEQELALTLLSYSQNKVAGPALLAFAQKANGVPNEFLSSLTPLSITYETVLKAKAITLCGNLSDPSLLKALGHLAFDPDLTHIEARKDDPFSWTRGGNKRQKQKEQKQGADELGKTGLSSNVFIQEPRSYLVRLTAARAISQVSDLKALPYIDRMLVHENKEFQIFGMFGLSKLAFLAFDSESAKGTIRFKQDLVSKYVNDLEHKWKDKNSDEELKLAVLSAFVCLFEMAKAIDKMKMAEVYKLASKSEAPRLRLYGLQALARMSSRNERSMKESLEQYATSALFMPERSDQDERPLMVAAKKYALYLLAEEKNPSPQAQAKNKRPIHRLHHFSDEMIDVSKELAEALRVTFYDSEVDESNRDKSGRAAFDLQHGKESFHGEMMEALGKHSSVEPSILNQMISILEKARSNEISFVDAKPVFEALTSFYQVDNVNLHSPISAVEMGLREKIVGQLLALLRTNNFPLDLKNQVLEALAVQCSLISKWIQQTLHDEAQQELVKWMHFTLNERRDSLFESSLAYLVSAHHPTLFGVVLPELMTFLKEKKQKGEAEKEASHWPYRFRVLEALSQFKIRLDAIHSREAIRQEHVFEITEALIDLSLNDAHSLIRVFALKTLSLWSREKAVITALKQKQSDPEKLVREQADLVIHP